MRVNTLLMHSRLRAWCLGPNRQRGFGVIPREILKFHIANGALSAFWAMQQQQPEHHFTSLLFQFELHYRYSRTVVLHVIFHDFFPWLSNFHDFSMSYNFPWLFHDQAFSRTFPWPWEPAYGPHWSISVSANFETCWPLTHPRLRFFALTRTYGASPVAYLLHDIIPNCYYLRYVPSSKGVRGITPREILKLYVQNCAF